MSQIACYQQARCSNRSVALDYKANMGTVREWIEVFVAGAFYAAWMLVWMGRQRRRDDLRPVLHIDDVLAWAPMGLWFGIVTTFHWQRAFHMPLLLITIGSFATACLIPIAFQLARKRRRSDEIRSLTSMSGDACYRRLYLRPRMVR